MDFKELGEGLQRNALPNCQVPVVLPKSVHLRVLLKKKKKYVLKMLEISQLGKTRYSSVFKTFIADAIFKK